MLLSLPSELLDAVVRALASERDVQDLRSVALVCRALLPIVRQELFKVLHVCAVYQPYMRPYFEHVVELRISEPVNDPMDLSLLRSFYFVPFLTPTSFPKLTALHCTSLDKSFFRQFPRRFLDALVSISSVTALTLSHAWFRHPMQPKMLLSALPNLSSLSLADFEVILGVGAPAPNWPSPTTLIHPRLSRLSIQPSVWSNASTHLCEWLADGPAAESLAELVVTDERGLPCTGILRHFGPSVRSLALPLREQEDLQDCMAFYTGLRDLTVVLEAYSTAQGPWYLLAPFFVHGIAAERLERVTIDVRVRYPMALASAVDWATLDRVNEELDEDRFGALRRVVFVLQWRAELGWCPEWEERETVARNVEARLHYLADAGKLETRVQVVKEFPDAVATNKNAPGSHAHEVLPPSA
ncbi:hypothetical protein OH77DRAFT_1431503 [Trametes cingulata]|nr:hypothetical protein OH77DRAFT_1431503 [Trametes cingulata]